MDLGRQEVMDAIFYDCSIDLPFIKIASTLRHPMKSMIIDGR